MQTIAVDFDGVIHTYEKGWQDGSIYGEFMPGAVGALATLMSKYAVFVHTTRKPGTVARWIEQKSGYAIECTTHVPRSGFWNQQGYLLVTDRKLPAYAYIDDRAVRFRSWSQALTALALVIRKDKAKKESHEQSGETR
jgi:hypothetical protein